MVDHDCFHTLDELKTKVQQEFNIEVSTSLINRCLREFYYTLKNALHVPASRNTNSTIEKRYEYALSYRQLEEDYPSENFVFLDEVGFKVETRERNECHWL